MKRKELDLILKIQDKEKELTTELFFEESDLDNKYTIERLKNEIKHLKREIKLMNLLK